MPLYLKILISAIIMYTVIVGGICFLYVFVDGMAFWSVFPQVNLSVLIGIAISALTVGLSKWMWGEE